MGGAIARVGAGFPALAIGTTAWRLCEPIGERKTVDYSKRWGVGNSEA